MNKVASWLSLVLCIPALAISACARHASAVSIGNCWRDVRYVHRDIRYSVVLRNEAKKPVAAVRVGFAAIDTQSATGLRHFITYDAIGPLSAGESRAVTLYTSPFSGATLYRSARLDCEILSVSFSDGSEWAIAPGIAAPDTVERASHTFSTHATIIPAESVNR